MKVTSTARRIVVTSSLIKTLVEAEARAKAETTTPNTAKYSELYCQVNETAALTSPYLTGGNPAVLEMQKLALEEMLGGPRRNKSLDILLSGHAITDQTRAEEAVKDIKISSKGAARAVGGRQDANRRDGRYGHSRGNHNGTRIDKTIAQELEAIHGQYLKDTEFLKSYYGGSHLIADTLEVVMARLAATADLDTARLNIAQMFRLVVEEIAVAGSDFPRRLREFSELLRQCMDSLDDDDDDED
ncbi:hypothetical protein AA0117_g2096 [Alternaria alternata]|uniref:Uncharacterized protein n=1 Tax=Alternaria alternata TaxID=5599 RepID=A0A4Q4NU27_ALTAL|nr:uncharacterized protein J4E82_000657 [Alternaria postmessia]KAI5380700.1 hypothetical protein J4E82_000657 [Alternaria postmessia]RYN82020.1 hypothetical protein AA0117_g2096 [Alternaria alternata]